MDRYCETGPDEISRHGLSHDSQTDKSNSWSHHSSSSRNFASTEKSSSVVVSPIVARHEAKSRKNRRMIFLLRVCGNASVNRISSGWAKPPIVLAPWPFSSSLTALVV